MPRAILAASDRTALRGGIWLVNMALVAVGCLLTLRTASDVAQILRPAPVGRAVQPVVAAATQPRRTQRDLDVILARNLFDPPNLAPTELVTEAPPAIITPPPPPPKKLELEIGLLGTIASSNAELRSATMWDARQRERFVVTEGDEVAGGLASVERIERGRVLIASATGATQQLVLDEDGKYRPPQRPRPRKRRARPARRRRARRSR